MKYYQLAGKSEKGEGSFSKQEKWKNALQYKDSLHKLMLRKAIVTVDSNYPEKGMSDFLKIGLGKLASKKIQQVFFEHGFTGAQFVPVEVINDESYQDYAFINALAHYDIFDPTASKAKFFDEYEGVYGRAVYKKIDQNKFNTCNIRHDIFTLTSFRVPYYVNEQVKEALEAAGITGIKFIPMEFSA